MKIKLVQEERICTDCSKPFVVTVTTSEGASRYIRSSKCFSCRAIAFELIREHSYVG
jgi:hypothetical protein